MRAEKVLWGLVVFAVVLGCIPIWAQALPQNGVAEIDTLFASAVQAGTVPGVVAIVASKDRILYYGASGLMDVARRKPMQKDAIFRIASMTKPLTAVSIMMLQEEGKLSVEDPVSKYIPALKSPQVVASYNKNTRTYTTRKATQPLLIRHLLTNTSGFGYAFSNYVLKGMRERTGKPTEQLPLLHEPGSQWTYGMSAKLLGQIVEKVSGVSLDQFFSNRILAPLDMQDTFYLVPDEKHDRLVTTHHRVKGRLTETPNPVRVGSRAAGDGGLFSTAADYVRFLQMLLNDGQWHESALLSKESVYAMTTNQIGDVVVQTQQSTDPAQSNSFPFGAGRDKFGFGFQITAWNEENPALRSAGSYSWGGTYNTHFWVDRKRQIAAVILMQVSPFYDDRCIQLYRDFEQIIGRNLRLIE